MNQEEYLALFEKYEKGEASPEEVQRLLCYRDDFDTMEAGDSGYLSEEYKKVRKRVLRKINRSTHRPKSVMYKLRWMAAAAVVLFAIIPLWKISHRKGDSVKPSVVVNEASAKKNASSNSAILVLSDGKEIVLNDIANGTISQQGGIIVSKQSNGMLQYTVASGATNAKVDTNTISTPRGVEYQVILPDGTKVWLNAASSLRYPVAFKGNERKVYLSGEAYFEVAKDKQKPFKVKYNNEEVEVLGTHFNIMAYKDEAVAKTTLVEGSVRIIKNDVQKILVPGQQAVSNNASGVLNVHSVNVNDVISWIDGYIVFSDMSIEAVMKLAQRWYDIDVEYQGDMSGKKFGGRISKYKDVSELLKNLEITGSIHFKTNGKKITIMP